MQEGEEEEAAGCRGRAPVIPVTGCGDGVVDGEREKYLQQVECGLSCGERQAAEVALHRLARVPPGDLPGPGSDTTQRLVALIAAEPVGSDLFESAVWCFRHILCAAPDDTPFPFTLPAPLFSKLDPLSAISSGARVARLEVLQRLAEQQPPPSFEAVLRTLVSSLSEQHEAEGEAACLYTARVACASPGRYAACPLPSQGASWCGALLAAFRAPGEPLRVALLTALAAFHNEAMLRVLCSLGLVMMLDTALHHRGERPSRLLFPRAAHFLAMLSRFTSLREHIVPHASSFLFHFSSLEVTDDSPVISASIDTFTRCIYFP